MLLVLRSCSAFEAQNLPEGEKASTKERLQLEKVEVPAIRAAIAQPNFTNEAVNLLKIKIDRFSKSLKAVKPLKTLSLRIVKPSQH